MINILSLWFDMLIKGWTGGCAVVPKHGVTIFRRVWFFIPVNYDLSPLRSPANVWL